MIAPGADGCKRGFKAWPALCSYYGALLHAAGSVRTRATTFDAIIIRSGISGGGAAKELCDHGLKTLVLERGRDVQHQPSGRRRAGHGRPAPSPASASRHTE